MRRPELLLLALVSSLISACSESTLIIAEPDKETCNEGKTICENDELSTCVDGEWVVEICLNGCNNQNNACEMKPITMVCDDGSFICINDVLKTCVDGDWVRTPCTSGCNADATACEGSEPILIECEPNEISCRFDIKKVCTNDGTYRQQVCPYGCNAQNTDCANAPENPSKCSGSEVICLNGNKKTCFDGTWRDSVCAYGCNAENTDCADIPESPSMCSSGQVLCMNNIQKTCLDGEWFERQCPYGCNPQNDGCAPKPEIQECSENEVICLNNIKKLCNDGIWIETTCPYGCNNQNNECLNKPETPAECSGSEAICINSIKKTCSGGQWTESFCNSGCNSAGTDCASTKICDENALNCNNSIYRKCENNSWVKLNDCEYGCNKSNTACAKCLEGSTCKNGKLSTCKDDKLTETTCQYGCDSTGKKCDEADQMQPTRYLMKTVHSPITPYVVEQMKKIMAKNNSRSNNVFIEIGDSHYDYDDFMVCYSKQSSQVVTLGSYANLQTVVDEFQKTKDSFKRDSLAAVGGTSTRDDLRNSPNLIAQEISAMNPRFAFFGYGTNDIGNGSYTFKNYMYNSNARADGYAWALQDYYRQITKAMDQLIDAGVIPLISGIIPNFAEPQNINYLSYTNPPACKKTEYPRYVVQAFNAASRGVAEARQLPWLDTYHLFNPLKNHGLQSDHIHGSRTSQYCDFSSTGLGYGVNNRNLHSVVMLDSAWRTVVKGEDAMDPIEEPFRGKGTQADPYLITSIPYTHQGNTNNGESKIDTYSGCGSANESGKEIYYKLELSQKKYVRMFAASASGVDVDIQIMKTTPGASNCIARSDIMLHGALEAGTYYISVDTFAGSGASGPGQYLFGIVECDNQLNGGTSSFDYDVDTLCQSKTIADAIE